MNPLVLGGRHAISYRISALFLPFLIFGIPLTENHPTKTEFIQWTIASSLSLIVTASLLFTFDKTLLKNRFNHPITNNQVFAVGVLLGAVRGAGTYLFALYPFHLASNTPSSGLIRVLNSSVLGGVSFVLIALISFSYYEVGRARTESRTLLSGMNQLLNTGKDERSQRDLFQAVSHRLEETRAKILQLAESESSLEKEFFADFLRELATNLIRPLSHQIAKSKPTGWQTFKDSASTMLLIPDLIQRQMPWLLFFYALGEVRVDLLNFGIMRGSILFALNIVTLAILMYILAYIFKRSKPRYVSVFIYPLIIGVVNASLNIVNRRIIHEHLSAANYVTTLSWTIFSIYLVSYAGRYVIVTMKSLSETKGKYSMMFQRVTSQVNSSRNLSEQLARFLHGSLQTKLNTSAFRVNQANSHEEIRKELQLVADYMSMPQEIDDIEISGDVIAKLAEIKETWSPLIQVTFDCSGPSSLPDLAAAAHLYDLINEVVSNAHRHGEANSITVRVDIHPHEIFVEATNDGSLLSSVKSGLGTKIFDAITNNCWSLRNHDGKVSFTATIPMKIEER